jgi:hypothetical protein
MIGFDWDVVRTLRLNKPGRSEGNPPALPPHGMDATDRHGGCGPGFTGRFPGPRRRRLAYREGVSPRARRFYRNGA